MLAGNETTGADECPALPALDAITDEHLFSIVASLLHSRQELRDAVIANLGERTEPNIPWVPVEALGSVPELDMRYLMPPSPTPPAPPPVKPPTRKRPSQGSRSTRARKSQRREGSNDTLLRLMRGEEVLDSSYTAVFKAEDERIGEHGSTAQPSSDASSRLESIDSAPSNLSDIKCFDPFANLNEPGRALHGFDAHHVPFDLFPSSL
ncbi:hypothetical protein FOZ62_030354 [Perkinsus olseni]|uniref:Uncharacterized protein n=2 Tax=Perkinsus olseni TaxID=32597 RepID=A0A7J6TEZ3_PEROL|nr:hypothetical protein FOZ62_030354 [Perkinsus olseni]